MALMIKNIYDLLVVLRIKREELLELRRDADSYYTTFYEPKNDKAGKQRVDKNGIPQVREINPSHGLLNKVQKRLAKYLSSAKFPHYLHGSIKGRSNVSNANAHRGKKYKFETDLKDYFPSITSERVLDTFRLIGFTHYIAQYLTRLTTYKGHLPQGAPTSSIISNLVFLEIDKDISDYCAQHEITYTRYIDDLTFSSHEELTDHTKVLIDRVVKDGFRISRKKTKLKKGPAIITGVLTRNNGLDVTDEYKKSIKGLKNDDPSKLGKISYMKHVRKNNPRQKSAKRKLH